jgi:hypothetical protein
VADPISKWANSRKESKTILERTKIARRMQKGNGKRKMHRIEDFEGPLQESNRAIKGFRGTRTTKIKIGTIVWRWNNDQGKHHKFVIPKLLYVPQGNIGLLSHQHWAQAQKDRKPTAGTGSETLDGKKQRECKLTVPVGRNDNVATFSLADGFKSFEALCAEAEVDYQQEQAGPIIAIPAQTVSDDKESDDNEVEEDDPSIKNERSPSNEEEDSQWPHTVDFDLDGATGNSRPIIVEDEEDVQPTNLATEMLRIHHQCGHISFARIQEMVKQTRHDTQKTGKMPGSRRKWQSKTANNRDKATEPSKPGDCV